MALECNTSESLLDFGLSGFDVHPQNVMKVGHKVFLWVLRIFVLICIRWTLLRTQYASQRSKTALSISNLCVIDVGRARSDA